MSEVAKYGEHRSPFLPGTKIQFAWDSTSLGYLKTCPRLYQYTMIEGFRRSGPSVHLDFGGWYHKALENYDKFIADGKSHDDALAEVVLEALKWTWINGAPWVAEKEDTNKTRETLVRSVIWYLEKYGPNDAAKTIILANGKPAVELSFRLELPFNAAPNQPYLLCGHLDRVVEFTGGTYVMDRKTTKTTLSSYYFDQYEPDNQMSLYSFAGKVMYSLPINGVVIDAVQIAVGFSRNERGFTFRTDAQNEEWIEDAKHWFNLARQFAEANYWPMNDKSCHQYGGCVFRKICSKSPEVRGRFLESDFTRRYWNPLEPR